jgi:CRP/FNR family transcriptional regulator, cyclic AMP receptor protein
VNDRSALLETLAGQPLVAALPADDRELLAGIAAFATLPAGALLTDEGAAVSNIWILVDGRVSVEVGRGAARTSIAVLGPGSLLGEASYLSGRPASASVTLITRCRLVEIAHARLRDACEQRPNFGLRFERLLVATFTERLSRSLGGGSHVELPIVDASSLKSLRTVRL